MGMLRLHYTLYVLFDKKQLPYALYVAFCTLIHCCDFNHALYGSRIWKSLHYAHYTLYADYAFQTDPINSMFVYYSHFQRREGLLFLSFSSALFNRQQQIQAQESISTVKPCNLCVPLQSADPASLWVALCYTPFGPIYYIQKHSQSADFAICGTILLGPKISRLRGFTVQNSLVRYINQKG